jgi:transposase
MAREFWLSDVQWAKIRPLLPSNQPGPRRVDDRRVVSGIVHVLKVGCRWQDTPALYGPSTTIYNRFRRWSAKGVWQALFQTLVDGDSAFQAIDSTTAKAHRSAAGGKGGPIDRGLAARAAGVRPRSMRSPTAKADRSPSP